MRALLGLFLALGLMVTPVMAGTDSPAGNTEGTSNSNDAASSPRTTASSVSAATAGVATGTVSSGASSAPAASASDSTSSSSAPTSQPAPAAATPQKTDTTDASPLGFKIGNATFTPLGFMDLTNVFRNRTIGSGIGTNFASAPYTTAANYPAAGLTEDRFSAQNSRIGIRVDSTVAGGAVLGYLEADFLGNAASSLSVTSNSATLRLRVYFVDYNRGKWEILGGQDWSMLTPSRRGIDPIPGNIFYTQDMDTNYQVGLVWERTPQFRIIFHPSQTVTFGVSLENPDQYFGGNGGVGSPTTPTGFTAGTEIDTTAGNGTNTPNVRPDIIAKLAFDPMIHGRDFHIDIAGVSREFKINTYTPATSTAVATSVNSSAEGAGGSFNFNFELFKNFHLIENAFWSYGGGRDIFDLAPDFIVRPQEAGGPFTISPLHAGSGIGGAEWQITPKTMIYGYYGIVYVGRNVALQPTTTSGSTCDGHTGVTCVGYGYAGATAAVAESQNREISEPTIGWIQTLWKNPSYGALSIITQASYLSREPWYVVSGTPKSAQVGMGFVDLRYTLP